MPVTATATALTGTIVDGRVVELDRPTDLPAGTRGRFVPDPQDEDDLGPPPDTHDRATELQILREALEDVKAGRGRPFRQVMDEIAAEFKPCIAFSSRSPAIPSTSSASSTPSRIA